MALRPSLKHFYRLYGFTVQKIEVYRKKDVFLLTKPRLVKNYDLKI